MRGNGADVVKLQTGDIASDGADGIACWFIDPHYAESCVARHA